MRTRNGDSAKSTPTKKTPPTRKIATRATSTPAETKRDSGSKAKQAKSNETTPPQVTPSSGSSLEHSAVGEGNAPADAAVVTPVKKTVASGTSSGVKKKLVKTRTPSSRKVIASQTPISQGSHKARAEESPKEEVEDAMTEENVRGFPMQELSKMQLEAVVENVAEGTKEEEEDTALEDDDEAVKEDQTSMEVVENMGDSLIAKEHGMEVAKFSEDKVSNHDNKERLGDSSKQKEPALVEVAKHNDIIEAIFQYKEETDEDPEEEELENVDDKEEPETVPVDKEEDLKSKLLGENFQSELDDYGSYEDYGDCVDYGEHDEEEFADDDMEEPADEAETLEDERRELNAIAKDRKIKKEHEIFIGGLDRDATEEDVRKVFERIGEVIEVRLHKNFSTNRNKGYAFVKFANKEHAKRALTEMKNPVICGKRCGTAPSEDNDTLFVGNICNTWTKEAIKQKLKDYGVEGVENINLVSDIQHEGLSRGFAFVMFSCHVDAMAAYKRLQKPDVVFGHPERTVKVAFAEPLREPDPEIMAHVKTVFLDGVPPHWKENQIRDQIKGYGDVIRIVLARNMSTAKRKDYGFIDFSTHEAAVACINAINNKEFSDGNSKVKLRARLSNPMPKTQAVKGGMSGGFRIGHGSSRTFSRYGRGSGRAGHHFNRANFQRGRGFYQHGRNHSSRMGPTEYDFDNRYTEFHGRQFIGRGGRSFRGGYNAPSRAAAGAGPSRSNPTRLWPDGPDRGYGEHHSYRRQPFSQGEDFDRPFIGRQVDDPYFYDDRAHGVKRSFHVMDHEPDCMGPRRFRPRLDYNDPVIPFHGSHHHDNVGACSNHYSDDYHVPNYGAHPPYPPYYGDDRLYGGGYFY